MSIKPRVTEFEPEKSEPAKPDLRRTRRASPKKRETKKSDFEAIPEAGPSKEVDTTKPSDLPCPAGAEAGGNAVANAEQKPLRENDLLLWLQYFRVLPTIPGQQDLTAKLVPHAVELHEGLNPKDALESMVARTLVGSSIAAMECFAIGANASLPAGLRESHLRLGFKGTEVVTQAAKALAELQNRPTGKEQPTNYTVNVKDGGQAIVGNGNRPLPKSSPSSVEDVPDDKE